MSDDTSLHLRVRKGWKEVAQNTADVHGRTITDLIVEGFSAFYLDWLIVAARVEVQGGDLQREWYAWCERHPDLPLSASYLWTHPRPLTPKTPGSDTVPPPPRR